jgi:hypothetical protein
MLISKEVEVGISSKNLSYFRDLGYDVPTHVLDKYRGEQVKKGTKIIVKVEDLILGSHVQVEVLCDYCKKEIATKSYRNFINSRKKSDKDCCDKCKYIKISEGKEYKYTLKDVQKIFSDSNCTLISKEIKGTHDYVEYRCNIHFDIVQKVILGNFIYGYKCKYCGKIKAANSKRHTYEYVQSYFAKRGYELISTEYTHARKKLKFRCPKHPDKIQSIALCDLQNRKGCKYCSMSSGATLIKLMLDELNLNYDAEYRFDDCRNIHPLPFDFVIFNKSQENKIDFLIEYDGEFHYKVARYSKDKNKMREKLKSQQKHDKIKDDYCHKNNIPLFRIPYWLTKNEMQNEILKYLNKLNIIY